MEGEVRPSINSPISLYLLLYRKDAVAWWKPKSSPRFAGCRPIQTRYVRITEKEGGRGGRERFAAAIHPSLIFHSLPPSFLISGGRACYQRHDQPVCRRAAQCGARAVETRDCRSPRRGTSLSLLPSLPPALLLFISSSPAFLPSLPVSLPSSRINVLFMIWLLYQSLQTSQATHSPLPPSLPPCHPPSLPRP